MNAHITRTHTHTQSEMGDVYVSSGYQRVPLKYVGREFITEEQEGSNSESQNSSMETCDFDYETDGGKEHVMNIYDDFARRYIWFVDVSVLIFESACVHTYSLTYIHIHKGSMGAW